MASGLCPFAWMFCMIYSRDWKMLLTSDSFFFKTKFLTGYYWIDTIEKQNTFFIFCRLVLNIFFSGIADASNFLIYVAKQKRNLHRKKVTANKLKPSDYGFNILNPINVKLNFNLAVHQNKTFVVILVNTYYVSSLILAKKQWSFAM